MIRKNPRQLPMKCTSFPSLNRRSPSPLLYSIFLDRAIPKPRFPQSSSSGGVIIMIATKSHACKGGGGECRLRGNGATQSATCEKGLSTKGLRKVAPFRPDIRGLQL